MKDNQKILVVDDTESNVDILVELLSDKYDVYAALDAQTAIEIAKDNKPRLILLDIVMPEMCGYSLCEKLKNNPATKDIPIIFITAKTDEESIEKAYDIGGIDYVTKPFKPKELLARVKTQIKLRKMIDSLEYLSSHDTMTGILNRRKFFEFATKRFENEKDKLFVVMIDIDRFKKINDTFGHHIGDKVIKSVVKTISKMLNEKTLFARLGGEEFVLLGNYLNKDSICQDIEKIRKEIEDLEINSDITELVTVTISSGISFYSDDFTSIDEFLKDADQALYEAKGSGRNKSVIRDN